jgi:hypothetical protein
MIQIGDVGGRVAIVDIGRDEIDMRRRRLPDVDHVPVRPTACGVFGAVLGKGIGQGGVAVHGQVEHRAPRRCDLVDISGDVPGVERLVGARPEDLAPAAGTADARQLGRHRAIEQALGRWREIARAAIAAGLVLDLDHDHIVPRIRVPDVRHQMDEGVAVRRQSRAAVRREDIMGVTIAGAHAREARHIRFHPLRRVAGAGILPGAEPEQHQPHMILPRLAH